MVPGWGGALQLWWPLQPPPLFDWIPAAPEPVEETEDSNECESFGSVEFPKVELTLNVSATEITRSVATFSIALMLLFPSATGLMSSEGRR